MIKQNQKYFNRFHVLLDAIVIYCSFCLSYAIRFKIEFLKPFLPETRYYRLLWQYQRMLIVIVPIYLLLYARFGLYKPKRFQHPFREVYNLVQANTLGLVCIFVYIFFLKVEHVPRSLLLIFYVVSMCLSLAVRILIRMILSKERARGRNLKHVIIVGESAASRAYIDRIQGNPQWGYYIHGIFADNVSEGFEYKGIRSIGKIHQLQGYLIEHSHSLDEVAIALSLREYHKLEAIVNICEKTGVHTKLIPDYYKFIPTNPVTEDLNGLPVINIRNVPLTNTFYRFIKRAMDIVGSLVCIIIFSPIMIVTAIAVKRSSPGPILFCQERIGLHNKPFKMYKFRSMDVQTAAKEKEGWTTQNDPRVTSVGKVIRKTSIDELPQLFNVLIGDMSLIGPRPERPQFVAKFKEEIPRYMIKHQVRPGMTGWAQVCGFRGDTSIAGRIECDIFYIENWSLGFDIKILFLTVFKGFVNKNAY